MARFYQIEEYMSGRYFRWLRSKRDRWFPRLPAIAMLLGVILSGVLQVVGLDEPFVHLAIWLAVCAVCARPEPVKETKKPFVRTSRATRLLGVTFALDALFVILFSLLGVESNTPAALSTIGIIGFIAFLLGSVMLIIANALLYPLEELFRRKFRRMAYQKLKASGAITIGITGSYGKTSTKTYTRHLLSSRFKTYATPKSYNTLMGVSRAINEDYDSNFGYQYFIAEMGAYIPGEIADICQLTEPQISIVSAVGPMHLERFGSIENIVKAKYEIIEGLPPDGAAIFNGDDPRVRDMAARGYPATRILVSRQGLAEARIVATNISQTPDGLAFDVQDRETGESQPFHTKLIGLHNVTNILLATAAARHVGMSLLEIAARVATLEPADHRLHKTVTPNNITILDDAYSANPLGASSALEVLKLHPNGRRIVITPGMVELGDLQEQENYLLGQLIAAAATDIVLVGIEQTQPLQRGVREANFNPERLLVFDTRAEAINWFQAQIKPGDAVLFLNDLPDTYL